MEKKITEIRKRDIRNALVDFCDRFGGQSKASKIMEGVVPLLAKLLTRTGNSSATTCGARLPAKSVCKTRSGRL